MPGAQDVLWHTSDGGQTWRRMSITLTIGQTFAYRMRPIATSGSTARHSSGLSAVVDRLILRKSFEARPGTFPTMSGPRPTAQEISGQRDRYWPAGRLASCAMYCARRIKMTV
jgi:hypothetical protein